MDSDRWAQIESIFERALTLPPAERPAFLEAACDGDRPLREEVEALLAADPVAEAYLHDLEQDVVAPAMAGALAGHDPLLGTRLGAYLIEEQIGRGGMGRVYRASRADGTFDQLVAVKVVRADLSDEHVARFFAERRILARLEHPAIARVYDAGTTHDGRPWLAMEYVDGPPVTTYADQAQLSINARLALFREICEAVSFAHRNLVVHRDLKPSNILVTRDGQVKLLDFGVAHLLADDDAPGLTRPGGGPMTPEYAAPEQVRGETITAATDVYALGVLLYELLTGRRPYRIPSRVRHEVERVILEEEPTRPSTAVRQPLPAGASGDAAGATTVTLSRARGADPAGLRRRLSGDLDVIVLKALRKEPGGRYGSAEALGEDVRRHLEGLPVAARPTSMAYRARKFVRRNRLAAAAAAVVLLSLMGGLGAALWQADRAAAEAERARTEATHAERITEFLVGLFEASDPAQARGDSVLVRDILDHSRTRLATDLAGEPVLRARFEATLGRVYQNLGLLDQADSLMSAALATQRERLGQNHVEAGQTMDLLGAVRFYKGNLDDAISLRRDALEIMRQEIDGDDPRVASVLVNLGHSLTASGDHDEAEGALIEAYEMHHRLATDGPTRGLATAANNLAILYYHRRDFPASTNYFQESLELQRVMHEDRPDPDIAITLDNISSLLIAQERYEEAEPYVRQAVAMQQTLYGAEPHQNMAISLNNLGIMLFHTGRFAEAQEAHQASLSLKERLFGRDHPSTATTLGWMGRLARQQGDVNGASQLFEEAIAITRAAFPPGHRNWMGPMHDLAALHASQGRWEDAEALYLEAYQQAFDQYGDDHDFTRQALAPLAAFYEEWGRPDRAAHFVTLAGSD